MRSQNNGQASPAGAVGNCSNHATHEHAGVARPAGQLRSRPASGITLPGRTQRVSTSNSSAIQAEALALHREDRRGCKLCHSLRGPGAGPVNVKWG